MLLLNLLTMAILFSLNSRHIYGRSKPLVGESTEHEISLRAADDSNNLRCHSAVSTPARIFWRFSGGGCPQGDIYERTYFEDGTSLDFCGRRVAAKQFTEVQRYCEAKLSPSGYARRTKISKRAEALSCCLMGVRLCTNPNYLEALCDQCGGHVRGDGV